MLQKNGLLDIINDAAVTDTVIVAITFDGGKISRFFSHVTGEFKLVDRRCIDPRTGGLLFGDNGIKKVQSHVHFFQSRSALQRTQSSYIKSNLRSSLLS